MICSQDMLSMWVSVCHMRRQNRLLLLFQ
ncbi:hypothetical protein Gotur_013653 [Gossypium turneri]